MLELEKGDWPGLDRKTGKPVGPVTPALKLISVWVPGTVTTSLDIYVGIYF